MPVTESDQPSPIHVPPTFPFILKQYAKAAIRTQPYDLLRWSATYFQALANGEIPPSKIRIEYDVYNTPSGLTPGYLKLLVKQLGTSGNVPTSVLYEKWTGICLNGNCLLEMLKIGGYEEKVHWRHFLGIAAGHLTDSLSETMNLLCHLLTEEPAGGPPIVPCETFTDLYAYLARLDCGPVGDADEQKQLDEDQNISNEAADGAEDETDALESNADQPDTSLAKEPVKKANKRLDSEGRPGTRSNPNVPGIGPAIPEVQIQATIAYMQFWSAKQRGYVMPRNMDNYLCPNIDETFPDEVEEAGSHELHAQESQMAN